MRQFIDKELNCNCPMGCSMKNGGCYKKWNYQAQDVARNSRPPREKKEPAIDRKIETEEWWG